MQLLFPKSSKMGMPPSSILPFFFLHLLTTLCLNLPSSYQSDHTSSQYILPVNLATPTRPTNLLLDLGSLFSWINCYAPDSYTSSTYRNIPCNFTVCEAIDSLACGYCYDCPPSPTCSNNTCGYFPENPYSRTVGDENAVIDVPSLGSSRRVLSTRRSSWTLMETLSSPTSVPLPNTSSVCPRSESTAKTCS
ncbi:hypothetical protein MLD38_040536 [Melastoma candidum]|nr:hypothetical protein MLD38_040536 [Melastoma candidum]